MYKIGEFSILAKTTIKTLRYYEKEKLLIPYFIDKESGYRYYETNQLVDLAKIISLRQIGLSINEIKQILINENDYNNILKSRKQNIEQELNLCKNQLTKINYILEGKVMNYEVITKELPEYTIYYKEARIKDFSEIIGFILSSGEECEKLNPDIKCISPDYCYINYLDEEFKKDNMLIRYAQAVEKEGISNETIKFKKLKPVNAVCIYSKGSYENLPNAYSFIMKYIEENNYEIIESPRERYIDGMWNKDSEEEWLTEIQVPVRKKN
ncbi:MAG: MerR family transcriptional regulator [Clostridiaceae bacterium]|nr:MerR family transcriptional regulator [Clostridiaceae bacterium]